MKNHHIAALFLFVFAGLSLYQGFHDGEMGAAVWTGIGLIVLGVIAFFYEKLQPWLRPGFVSLPLIIVVGLAIKSAIDGDVIGLIGWGICSIIGGVVAIFQDRPFFKEKVRPGLRVIPLIALSVLFIFELFIIFTAERKTAESLKPVGELQKPSVSPESARNGDLQGEKSPVSSDLQQKVMNILNEEVKQEIKDAAETGSPPEFLESFSKFKDYMISKGMTEFAILDQAPSHFQDLFQKHHPGKTPSDLDAEMRHRLIDMIQESGYERGRNKFLQTPEVGIWAAARFNFLSDNQESITAWIDDVYIGEEGDTKEAPGSVSPPPAVSQGGLPFEENDPDLPFAVPLDRASTASGEDPATPDTDYRGVTPPAVKPEKVVTEASLKERFSSERLDRAKDTLERYGPEEGLRRLRESDPEIARQMEQRRDREDKESAPSRRGEHE